LPAGDADGARSTIELEDDDNEFAQLDLPEFDLDSLGPASTPDFDFSGGAGSLPGLADFDADAEDPVTRLRGLIEERREETIEVLRGWMDEERENA
jgi:flagellar M-ring protein FliF